jgi:hypothetical protein
LCNGITINASDVAVLFGDDQTAICMGEVGSSTYKAGNNEVIIHIIHGTDRPQGKRSGCRDARSTVAQLYRQAALDLAG